MVFYWRYAGAVDHQELRVTKQEALAAMKLLAAVESWAFSLKERMPDYLHEDLCRSMDVLERIILEKP